MSSLSQVGSRPEKVQRLFVFNRNSPCHNGRKQTGGSVGRSQQGQVLAGSVNGVRREEEMFLLSCVSVFFGGPGDHTLRSREEEEEEPRLVRKDEQR